MADQEAEPTKRILDVDLDTLEISFSTASYEMSCYLDEETGKVITVLEDARQEFEDLRDEWEQTDRSSDFEVFLQHSDTLDWMMEAIRDVMRVEDGYGSRYVQVPQADSSEGYRDMEDFTLTVGDELLQRRLEQALDGKKPFRRFKDVLHHYPQERDRWFQFEHDRLAQRVLDWLESLGIEPILE